MTDQDLLALCVWTEARGEPLEGKVAVARVVWNRMAEHYESNGTVPGTVLKYDQFSAFYFTMVGHTYTRIHSTPAGAMQEALRLLPVAQESAVWEDCLAAVESGKRGSSFAWGPAGRLLDAEPRTLLYCNRDVSDPVWATEEAHVCDIYHHSFYKA
jgi:hypothetical protein